MKKISLTREGYDKIVAELGMLKKKRIRIAGDIDVARALGDLSENAEYHAAREAQAHNERKIAELEDTLSRAQILDSSAIASDEAWLGNVVKMKDGGTGEIVEYILVSEEESDYAANKISASSPVGRALLGHKVGDKIEIKIPRGFIEYVILEIKRA